MNIFRAALDSWLVFLVPGEPCFSLGSSTVLKKLSYNSPSVEILIAVPKASSFRSLRVEERMKRRGEYSSFAGACFGHEVTAYSLRGFLRFSYIFRACLFLLKSTYEPAERSTFSWPIGRGEICGVGCIIRVGVGCVCTTPLVDTSSRVEFSLVLSVGPPSFLVQLFLPPWLVECAVIAPELLLVKGKGCGLILPTLALSSSLFLSFSEN